MYHDYVHAIHVYIIIYAQSHLFEILKVYESGKQHFLALVSGSCVLSLTYVSENILNTPTDALWSPFVY